MVAYQSARGGVRWLALALASSALVSVASLNANAQPAPNQVVLVPRPDTATGHSVSGINYDGSVIFGGASYGSPNRPFVWKGGATSTDLGAFTNPGTGLPYTFNGFGAVGSNAVSDDGKVLVGTSSSSGTPGRAWIWREGTGYQDLGLPAGFGGLSALAVSRDGTTVVGLTSVNQSRAYRWRAATGFELLNVPVIAGETYSAVNALGVNGDGNVIVGSATRTLPTAVTLPAVWTPATGYQIIVTGYGTGAGQARAVSADGTIIGGRALPNARQRRIFRRDGAGTILLIDPMAGDGWTEFRGMSADGSKIVGISGNDATAGRQAILWTTTDGARSLNAIIAAANLPDAGLNLRLATGISGDGSTIIGSGRNAAGQDLPFAFRQVTITRVPTMSKSLTQLLVPDALLQNILTTTYDTGVAATLHGETVFDLRSNEMVSGPAVQQAFLDAGEAIRDAAGLRRVTIEAPYLARSETQTIAVTGPVETQTVQNLPDEVNVYTTNGPATVATGDLGICTDPGNGTTGPSGCSLPGTLVAISETEINDNTHTASFQRITRVLTTTTEERLFQDWSISGVLGSQLGTVHAIAGSAALDSIERFTRRLLGQRIAQPPMLAKGAKVAGDVWPQTTASPYVAILEGYGIIAQRDADPSRGIADVDIEGEGLTGALAFDVNPSLTVGIGGELASRDAKIRDPLNPEALDLNTLQGGLFAVYRTGRFSAAAAVSGGRGSIDTRIAGDNGPQSASYDATIWSAAIEAGYDIPLSKTFTVAPMVGAQWNRADIDGFAEAGPGNALLIGRGTELESHRVWAGLRASATFDTDAGTRIVPNVYARYVHRDGDFEGHADVAFANAPATPLVAHGPRMSGGGVEVGAALDIAGDDNTTIRVGYDGGFADGYENHEFKASLTVRF